MARRVGVFFGMAVAWDLVDEIHVRGDVGYLMDRLLSTLDKNGWTVVMPDGSSSTSFSIRPDQQLTLLQIGRHINPNWFASKYSNSATFKFFLVPVPIGVEVLDVDSSYFKFNLDTINLFSLIRWENNDLRRTTYKKAYDTLRNTTDDHQNAHFNMIDRALNGPNARRDAETVQLLRDWLLRPRRDVHVDLRGVVDACGDNRACQPVPVAERVTTDFLWQRSPFQMYGSGEASSSLMSPTTGGIATGGALSVIVSVRNVCTNARSVTTCAVSPSRVRTMSAATPCVTTDPISLPMSVGRDGIGGIANLRTWNGALLGRIGQSDMLCR